jgi:hypothetical protein
MAAPRRPGVAAFSFLLSPDISLVTSLLYGDFPGVFATISPPSMLQIRSPYGMKVPWEPMLLLPYVPGMRP